MPNATLHDPDKTRKPADPVSIPAKIPPNWMHTGAVARAIIARLERKMGIEARRCWQVRRLAERHIGGHYDPALSNLLVRLLTAEEALRQ